MGGISALSALRASEPREQQQSLRTTEGMKLTEFDGLLIRKELRVILRLPGWVTTWEAAGTISLHREHCRLRRGAPDFALERKCPGENVQASARYMGCLDPEFPCATKPADIEKLLGRRSLWWWKGWTWRSSPREW